VQVGPRAGQLSSRPYCARVAANRAAAIGELACCCRPHRRHTPLPTAPCSPVPPRRHCLADADCRRRRRHPAGAVPCRWSAAATTRRLMHEGSSAEDYIVLMDCRHSTDSGSANVLRTMRAADALPWTSECRQPPDLRSLHWQYARFTDHV